jgi:hypothetical protein
VIFILCSSTFHFLLFTFNFPRQWLWSCPQPPSESDGMLEGAGMPVIFNPVGSGVEAPTAPDRAAKEDITRRIGAWHSRHAVNAGSDTP